MKILVAPNSFKECASSFEISKLIASKISEYLENAEVFTLALSDGGDGFLDVCKEVLDLSIISVPISSNGNFPLKKAPAGISKDGTEAYIESANLVGMKLLLGKISNVKMISSAALGDAIKYISMNWPGIEKIIVGIGGTATNDIGIGALTQLGVKCIDSNGKEITSLETMMKDLEKIEFDKLDLPRLIFVTDVDNPLLGEKGATRVFGPQKGVKNEDFEVFESFFEKVIKLSGRKVDPNNLSGAGGGIPAGFQLFYESEVISSREFFRNFFNFEKYRNSDYVITAEGIFDDSSLSGKATGNVLKEFENASKFLICWKNESTFDLKNLTIIELSKYFTSKEESISKFREGIHLACKEISEEILFNQKVH